MSLDKITDYETTPADNVDVGNIGIAGSSSIRLGNDAIQTLMSHLAKVNAGTDPIADTWTFGDPSDLTKRVRLDAGNVTAGQTRVAYSADFDVDESTFVSGYGFGLAASVSSNALTISLKTNTGADPSASKPVVLSFRDATAATGTPVIRSLTAATSLTISSGSTMGFTSGSAGRLWIVAFDDGGTIQLGAINCLSGTNVRSLTQSAVASSTAEGGSGGADSAHVFYTGSAVTSKPYVVLGVLEWSSGLTTAGTWDAGPTLIKTHQLGDKLPGDILQRQFTIISTQNQGTGLVPADNTTPQSSEGDEYLSQAITPVFASSVLVVEAEGTFSHTSNAGVQALFLLRDSGANALATAFASVPINERVRLHLKYAAKSDTSNATTFKVRSGNNSSGTTIMNESFYNDTENSWIEVVEMMT